MGEADFFFKFLFLPHRRVGVVRVSFKKFRVLIFIFTNGTDSMQLRRRTNGHSQMQSKFEGGQEFTYSMGNSKFVSARYRINIELLKTRIMIGGEIVFSSIRKSN